MKALACSGVKPTFKVFLGLSIIRVAGTWHRQRTARNLLAQNLLTRYDTADLESEVKLSTKIWYQGLGTHILAQDRGTRVWVPESWYRDLDTKIPVPRSWC